MVNNDASINIGSRTYINEFDANPNFVVDPTKPATQAEAPGDAGVLFTSLYDYDATTPLIPNKINSANDTMLANGETANQPDLMNSVGSNLVKLSDGTAGPDRPLGERRHPVGRGRRDQRRRVPLRRRRGQRPGWDAPLTVGARVHHAGYRRCRRR